MATDKEVFTQEQLADRVREIVMEASGKEVEGIVNYVCGEPVKYLGDSLYERAEG